MVISGRIANKLGIFSQGEQMRLKGLIQRAGLPTEIPDLSVDRVIQAMEHDKKILHGRIKFILPKSIGRVFVTDEVSSSMIRQVLAGSSE
jgi:3-dehydroquinate synthase